MDVARVSANEQIARRDPGNFANSESIGSAMRPRPDVWNASASANFRRMSAKFHSDKFLVSHIFVLLVERDVTTRRSSDSRILPSGQDAEKDGRPTLSISRTVKLRYYRKSRRVSTRS